MKNSFHYGDSTTALRWVRSHFISFFCLLILFFHPDQISQIYKQRA